jgi:hypothetical protein
VTGLDWLLASPLNCIIAGTAVSILGCVGLLIWERISE